MRSFGSDLEALAIAFTSCSKSDCQINGRCGCGFTVFLNLPNTGAQFHHSVTHTNWLLTIWTYITATKWIHYMMHQQWNQHTEQCKQNQKKNPNNKQIQYCVLVLAMFFFCFVYATRIRHAVSRVVIGGSIFQPHTHTHTESANCRTNALAERTERKIAVFTTLSICLRISAYKTEASSRQLRPDIFVYIVFVRIIIRMWLWMNLFKHIVRRVQSMNKTRIQPGERRANKKTQTENNDNNKIEYIYVNAVSQWGQRWRLVIRQRSHHFPI